MLGQRLHCQLWQRPDGRGVNRNMPSSFFSGSAFELPWGLILGGCSLCFSEGIREEKVLGRETTN